MNSPTDKAHSKIWTQCQTVQRKLDNDNLKLLQRHSALMSGDIYLVMDSYRSVITMERFVGLCCMPFTTQRSYVRLH